MKGTFYQIRLASASAKAAWVLFSETDALAISSVFTLEVLLK